MLHRIDGVYPMPDFVLGCKFSEGAILLYDLKPLFKAIPAFTQLAKQPELYSRVKASAGGYGVVWNDSLDLSRDEMWEHGWHNWNSDQLGTIDMEIDSELLRMMEDILRPYGLRPEDWAVMALEFCVFPATQNTAAKMLLGLTDRMDVTDQSAEKQI